MAQRLRRLWRWLDFSAGRKQSEALKRAKLYYDGQLSSLRQQQAEESGKSDVLQAAKRLADRVQEGQEVVQMGEKHVNDLANHASKLARAELADKQAERLKQCWQDGSGSDETDYKNRRE